MKEIKKNRLLHFFVALMIISLIVPVSGCAKDETITFTAKIETLSENTIEVQTIDYEGFESASVDLGEAEYDFDPEEGQVVKVTIKPEIRESYPVQVTATKLELIEDAKREIGDYFPITANARYVYEGQGNEYASYETFTDYAKENSLQQMVSNGGTVSARVYKIEEGKLIRTLSEGEVYYRENFLDEEDDDESGEILLKEPLEEGTSWTLDDGRQRTITDVSSQVKTPFGDYNAIEVLTEGDNGTNVDYYVRDVGLIKTIFQSGGLEVSSTLQSIEKDTVRTEMVNFYYPDSEDSQFQVQKKGVTYHTNDSTADILEDAYRDLVSGNLGIVFTTNAGIKSLSLDEDNRVRLDLNSAFVSEMNAGAGYEQTILQCVANTFGQYYNSEEVVLTIEGEPYESGHIKMEEDQAIKTNFNDVKESIEERE